MKKRTAYGTPSLGYRYYAKRWLNAEICVAVSFCHFSESERDNVAKVSKNRRQIGPITPKETEILIYLFCVSVRYLVIIQTAELSYKPGPTYSS